MEDLWLLLAPHRKLHWLHILNHLEPSANHPDPGQLGPCILLYRIRGVDRNALFERTAGIKISYLITGQEYI